jgi:hypothetical protein
MLILRVCGVKGIEFICNRALPVEVLGSKWKRNEQENRGKKKKRKAKNRGKSGKIGEKSGGKGFWGGKKGHKINRRFQQ